MGDCRINRALRRGVRALLRAITNDWAIEVTGMSLKPGKPIPIMDEQALHAAEMEAEAALVLSKMTEPCGEPFSAC